jgi:predicted RNA-binding Zn ribbon-like protein
MDPYLEIHYSERMDWWRDMGVCLAVDLANTSPDDRRPDVLGSQELVARWLELTGGPPDSDAPALRALRGDVEGILSARTAGRRLPHAAVEQLNAAVRAAPSLPQLENDELVYVAAASPDAAFRAEIACSAIELLGRGPLPRRCAGPGCGRLVVGRADRRWCGDRCGNRFRVAHHRQRQGNVGSLTDRT